MPMQLTSPAFENNALIPQMYTCDGDDISPPLRWADAPAETRSFVLICDDPDAPMGTWDHWLLFNIPRETDGLEENIVVLPTGTLEGKNSWGNTGYGGPCPPDREHRYVFSLYALDTMLDLEKGADKKAIQTAQQGHVLADAQLLGRYDRPRE